MRGMIALAAFAAFGAAAPLAAQGRGRGNGGVPPGQRPPAGMCRVWIDGMPPGHQPRPTDCSTAVATVPRNGRVIWGDQTTSQRVYDPRVYDPRVYDPRVNDSRVYDPRIDRSRVYSSNGDLPSTRACSRQIVNGVVRTVCDQRHKEKNKHAKNGRRNDGDRDDRFDRSASHDRADHDRFVRR